MRQKEEVPLMKATCSEEHDGVPCGRQKSKRSNKWCNWHWLLQQPPSVRDADAARRKAGQQNPDVVREGDKQCNVCLWFVAPFYMGRGRRCVGCEGIAQHESKILNTYDLRRGDWQALNELQRGRCAICRHRQVKKRLATDHDHPTDVVRGLLCQWCNENVLGSIGGDTEKALPIARALVYYLECHPSSGRWQPPEDQSEFGFPEKPPVNLPIEVSILGESDPAGMQSAPY
jgi:hypothetical protein